MSLIVCVQVQDIIDFINMRPSESGIIYARLRKSCDLLTSRLRDADIEASAFHAGLSSDAKRLAQSSWMENAVNVMCATIAFGMGTH
jgi:ATP-dependent DNA helicase RecQ